MYCSKFTCLVNFLVLIPVVVESIQSDHGIKEIVVCNHFNTFFYAQCPETFTLKLFVFYYSFDL